MRGPRGCTWPLVVVVLLCAGCSTAPVSPESSPGVQASVSPEPDSGVQILAKADGWVVSQAAIGPFYAVVEVAYDEIAAAQAWENNVPADLAQRSGDPARPGLYGGLEDIDFDREALVVYSSGQSGTCPEWVTGIEFTTEGVVQITTTFKSDAVAPGGVLACTADYVPYRIVLAIDRDKLPPISALPTTRVLINGEQLGGGGLVTTYPAAAA